MPSRKKKTHAQIQKEFEIENRRMVVAANLLAGHTYRSIAKSLGVSLGTVSSDVKAIMKEWRKHYRDTADNWVQVQSRRYDVLINRLWDNAKADNLPVVDRVLKTMEAQSKLLGLNQEPGSSEDNPMYVQRIEVIKTYMGDDD